MIALINMSLSSLAIFLTRLSLDGELTSVLFGISVSEKAKSSLLIEISASFVYNSFIEFMAETVFSMNDR